MAHLGRPHSAAALQALAGWPEGSGQPVPSAAPHHIPPHHPVDRAPGPQGRGPAFTPAGARLAIVLTGEAEMDRQLVRLLSGLPDTIVLHPQQRARAVADRVGSDTGGPNRDRAVSRGGATNRDGAVSVWSIAGEKGDRNASRDNPSGSDRDGPGDPGPVRTPTLTGVEALALRLAAARTAVVAMGGTGAAAPMPKETVPEAMIVEAARIARLPLIWVDLPVAAQEDTVGENTAGRDTTRVDTARAGDGTAAAPPLHPLALLADHILARDAEMVAGLVAAGTAPGRITLLPPARDTAPATAKDATQGTTRGATSAPSGAPSGAPSRPPPRAPAPLTGHALIDHGENGNAEELVPAFPKARPLTAIVAALARDSGRLAPARARATDPMLCGWPDPSGLTGRRVMAVLDTPMAGDLAPLFDLILPTPDNWRGLFKRDNPHLLLIGATREGNGGSWRGHMTCTDPQLAGMIGIFRAHGLPVWFHAGPKPGIGAPDRLSAQSWDQSLDQSLPPYPVPPSGQSPDQSPAMQPALFPARSPDQTPTPTFTTARAADTARAPGPDLFTEFAPLAALCDRVFVADSASVARYRDLGCTEVRLLPPAGDDDLLTDWPDDLAPLSRESDDD